jgi:PPOX class probable F420-dependent enzyme
MTALETAVLPGEARLLLESDALGHVVTLDPDGTPHVSGVWLGLDGDDVLFASMYRWRKIRNLQRDPRVSVSLESPDRHATGLQEYLILRGHAEVAQGGAFDLLHRLARTYLGPDAEFPPAHLRAEPGFVARIHVEACTGIGPWAGGPPGPPNPAG